MGLQEGTEKRFALLMKQVGQQNVTDITERLDELFAGCVKNRNRLVELSALFASSASDAKTQLATEVKERTAADEKAMKFGREVQLRVSTEIKALESLVHQHGEMQSFKGSLIAAEERAKNIVSAKHQTLLSKIEEQASMFRQDLDEEIHLRNDCITSLTGQVDTYKQELKALESFLHQQIEQHTFQMQSLRESLTAAEEHQTKLSQRSVRHCCPKIEDQASVFRQNLDKEIHLRSDCITNLTDQVDMYKQDTFNALTQEGTERESETHNLQVSLNELREKAELFKTEMDDTTRRVGSIELHILDSFVRAGPLQMAPPPTTKPRFAQPLQPSLPLQAGQFESPVSPLGINRQPVSPATKSVSLAASMSKSPATAIRTTNGFQPPILQPITEGKFPMLSGTSLDGGQGKTVDLYEQNRINC